MSHTRSQYKSKIDEILGELDPMLSWVQSEVKPVTGEESRKDLKECYLWLIDLRKDWYFEYRAIVTQPHTGDQFWANVKTFGLDPEGMFGDVAPVVQMRRFLKKLKTHMSQPKRPVLYGGKEKRKPGRPSGTTKTAK